jgi:hypothetical protein
MIKVQSRAELRQLGSLTLRRSAGEHHDEHRRDEHSHAGRTRAEATQAAMTTRPA